MKNKILLTSTLLLFISFVAFSQKEQYSIASIPLELTENANAIVRNSSVEITIDAIDKMIVKERKVVTVLNKLGNVDARMSKGYDNDTKITRLSVRVYNAQGIEIQKYKKNKFLDISAVDGFSLYTDARIKYLDYTPTAYPYTIVFDSEYKTSSTGFIQGWYPVNGYFIAVQKSSYQLNNPSMIPYRKKEMNFKDFNIERSETNTKIAYTLKDQKAFKYENSSVNSRDFLPQLKIATNKFYLKGVYGEVTNWKEFGIWMHNSLLKGRDALDGATKTKVLNLVKDVTDPIERAKIVYKYMQEKTRYISVQVGIGGWEPIAANQVDKVGYGDCKGLTNYTKALLDVAGVPSYYTVVYANEKRDIDKEFTSIQGNHVILNIPNKENDVWLECTSQTMPFGFLGDFTEDRNVLVITPEGGIIKRTPAYKNDINLQVIKADIQLDEKGNVKATLERTSEGIQYDDKYSYTSMSKEDLIKYYKSNVWSYNNNFEIKNVTLENNEDSISFKEKLSVSIQDYASLNQGEYLFRVNIFNKINQVPKRYRNRKLPLKVYRGYKDIDEYKIKIPTGFSIGVLPVIKEITNKFGSYTASLKKIDDSTLLYKRTILIKSGEYPKEDYKIYRKFRKTTAKLENLRIALTKK